jgi:hypothetical protein
MGTGVLKSECGLNILLKSGWRFCLLIAITIICLLQLVTDN